jgi:Fungal Zn(2)-Cys(6) binuclear cluster domain
MRGIQTKSRWGCKECKLRRVKCDESRPSCTRCSKARRLCSYEYLGGTAVVPLPSPSNSGSTVSGTTAIPLVLPPLLNTPDPASPGSTSFDPVLKEHYSLLHLQLLNQFEHGLNAYKESFPPGLDAMVPIFLRQGLTTPYLMDEILAYTAAHKSTLSKETRLFYITEATRLQTRALTLYNGAKPEVSDETCLPMFLFASLLGHHLLFDLYDSPNDLGAILDGLTRSIGVHRGISAIARSSWPRFSEDLQNQFLQTCVREGYPTNSISQGECESLLKRLDASELSLSAIAVHRQAAELLQSLFDNHGYTFSFKKGNLAAVQDWLIGISAEYIQCLNQRRPEALVVLAHYAVFLHRGAQYWFIGDLGRRLIHLINGHLGPLWADWLQWPSQIVE